MRSFCGRGAQRRAAVRCGRPYNLTYRPVRPHAVAQWPSVNLRRLHPRHSEFADHQMSVHLRL
jgi:hypothetical protein